LQVNRYWKIKNKGVSMRKMMVFLTVVVSILAFNTMSFAVTTTDLNTLTPQQLVQQLVGSGVSVSNVTYTGANNASGSFSGAAADGISIDSGVILTSGDVANAQGPNTNDGLTTNNSQPGDSDLNALISGTTFDASVLEFDFVPTDSSLVFSYVFGSEEYNEFVGQINDVFAFFLDGVNIALIPGTSTPVAVNNINNSTNPSFYNDNDPSDLGTPTPFNIQYDGFTTVLTAQATVTPGNTHHIKLVIADTSDSILDSAVFIQAGSFQSTSCGDGVLDPGEQCDDGNLINGDGCDSNCTIEGAIADVTVPTMTEWGMIIFIVLAGLGSVYYLRRKRMNI
jgi:cysteine-rich repeat protein